MFYAHFVLAKKGPLARIWLAAHWDKKLTKAHVFETNIEKSVDGILQPKVKMALRTSGHLLLGVVRIYSRKAKYLLADCNEAFVKIKMAFRPGMVDLPEEFREAAVSAITFPEVFHDFDTPMPELNDVDIQAQFTLNQSRAEEITMREDYGNISLAHGDDGFGDMAFEGPPELMRANIEHSMDQSNLIFGDHMSKDREINASKEIQNSRLENNEVNSALDLDAPIRDDGFGGNLGQDIMTGGLFEGGLFDDAPMEEPPALDVPLDKPQQKKPQEESDDDVDQFGGPPSVGPQSSEGGSPRASPVPPQEGEKEPEEPMEEAQVATEQTVLIRNEEESFSLAPVDASVIKSGWPRSKRKRKLIVDEIKNISGEEMKAQLSDTLDIVTTLDLAPPSKRLMHWKETGGVEKLFGLPGRAINAIGLGKIYIRNHTSEYTRNEDFGLPGDAEIDNLRLEHVGEDGEPAAAAVTRRRQNKRKLEPEIPQSDRTLRKQKTGEESFNELINETRADPPPPPAAADPPSPLMSPLPADLGVHDDVEDIVAPAPVADIPSAEVDNLPENEAPKDTSLDQNNEVFDSLHDNINQNDHMPPPPSPKDHMPPPPSPNDHMPLPPSPMNQNDDDYEQFEDETYEEFEERVLNKRAANMFANIKKVLAEKEMKFSQMSRGQDRKIIAQKFYTLLTLKKLQAVELCQGAPYTEITISKGTLFENAKL